MIDSSFGIPPNLPVYNDDGTYMEPAKKSSLVSESLFSPLDYINEQSNTLAQKNVFGNLALSYKIIDGLTLKIMSVIESSNGRKDFYQIKNFFNNSNDVYQILVNRSGCKLERWRKLS